MGIFNGVITGNCSEILEVTDNANSAVCNLASIALPTYIEGNTFNFEKLHTAVKIVTKNLNKVIDINYYPVEKTKRSNMTARPIGIGVQGLADTYTIMRYPFDSPEAMQLNKDIFETMYHAALEASMELCKKRMEQNMVDQHEYVSKVSEKYPGSYMGFEGSPASNRELQFDMWGVNPSSRFDWENLKDEIQQYGLRNSLLMAPMPTASTSQILGFNECFEPWTSLMYKRKTMAGEFILVNKYLVRDLVKLGMWTKDIRDQIIINDGSIQNIADIPDELKNLYKTVWEIKQKVLIDQSADRGAFVCQSQSLNLFMEDPDFKKLSSMHMYAWQKGLKTGMYYLRSKAKAQAQKFTIDPSKAKLANLKEEKKKNFVCTETECTMCSS
jgi:ribonucleoside-diphosphate reductase alpha chain